MDRPPALVGEPPAFQREFLHPRHWHIWLLLGALLLLGLVPRRLRDLLADGFGYFTYRFHTKRSLQTSVNLAWCFPQLSEAERERLALRHFQAQAGAMLDIPPLRFASIGRLRRLTPIDGLEHMEKAQRQGRPVILLCGHSSAIDAGGLALSIRTRTVSVFNPFKSALTDWLMFNARTRFDMQLARRDEGLRPLVRAIRDGAVLVHIADEDLGEKRSVFAEFFGQQKATVPVLGRLAKMCDAVVIPCYTWYDRRARHYRGKLFPALDHTWGEDIAVDARTMNRALQQTIELCPEQYMWSMRIFKTRPPGEPSPYKRL
jgi:lipid A biosynthesis (KDO)2-(lauroyl)-lipid IVA acyltransferase